MARESDRQRSRARAWIAWGSAVAAGLVALGAFALVSASPGKLDRKSEKAKVRELGERVEAMGILPGFADFLVAVAFIESRFNPEAAGKSGEFGWFQLLPGSAFNSKNGLGGLSKARKVELLKSRPWAVASAADFARRLIPFAAPAQVVTFYNLRHGWKRPRLIAETESTGAAKNALQLTNAAIKTGVPVEALDRVVELGDWPGIVELAAALGGEAP